ncbi:PhnD/SsuA/transferrin family substrate-binding protein [Streptomyces sp. A0592]|uniref:phosphate/phosphite/phosphonate ABC transporter substrate-binding protein n=1 Tax=Streptomyces sp. A0592 TaxID=2563099 RepID=UPI001448087D|nr:PhnD/SsuA/transferrin family substrate-binding protein [Streptomyces sp. A0592]
MAATFLYDANLRLEVDSPEWSGFLGDHGIHVAGYHGDMAPLTKQLEQHTATFSYLPVLNYFYLRADPVYEPIASAVYAADGTTGIPSVLVVPAGSEVTEAGDLRGKRLAIAHRFCTTSFLAPMLMVHDLGSRIDEFFSELVITPPYEGQLEAVLAGAADATFIQEDVWLNDPANAERTRVIARRDHLPTPLFIASREAPLQLRSAVRRFVLNYRSANEESLLFSGFAPYDAAAVKETLRITEEATA